MPTISRTIVTEQDPQFRLLLIDRERPNWRAALTSWLGEDATARLLALGEQRFLVVATMDTRGDPRFLHVADLLMDLDALISRVVAFTFAAELLARPGAGRAGIDMNFFLLAPERDRLNAALDRLEAERLLRMPARGAA